MLDKVDPVHDFLVAWEKEGPLNGNKSLDRASYMLRAETNKHLNGKFLLVEINHPAFGDAEYQAALTKVHREQFRRTNPALYDVLEASSDPDVKIPACYHTYMLYSLNGTATRFADDLSVVRSGLRTFPGSSVPMPSPSLSFRNTTEKTVRPLSGS
jgi:hypothetical protein